MRYALSVALLALPMTALAGPVAEPVIGGSAAPAGKWPDAAAVLWSGEQACTGTLIAPNVVITPGHCGDPRQPDPGLVTATE
jgi:secreted trypsin-like serine protease